MTTSYDRIETALKQARRKSSWASAHELASELRQRRLAAFRLRGDGSSIDHYMQDTAIKSLLRFSIELGLLEENPNGTINITDRGRAALTSDDAYARQMRSSVKSYLQNHSFPFETLLGTIAKIELPDVPDAKTIFEQMEQLEPRPNLNEAELRRALFLLACADGLERSLKVHYGQE